MYPHSSQIFHKRNPDKHSVQVWKLAGDGMRDTRRACTLSAAPNDFAESGKVITRVAVPEKKSVSLFRCRERLAFSPSIHHDFFSVLCLKRPIQQEKKQSIYQLEYL